ncbi:MAG: HD-GYP domain-containing protein [Psychrobium sp.]
MKDNSASIKLTIDRLQPGVYIKLPVRWNAHPFMFNQFKITSQNQIALLKQANIKHVYAIPSKSDANPLPVVDHDAPIEIDAEQDTTLLKNKLSDKEQQILAMQQHRRAIKECEQAYQNALSKVRSLTSKIQSRPLVAIEEAQSVMTTMTKALLGKDDLVLHLVGDDRDDMDSYQHAISVSILVMMIGKKLGLKESEISDLGTAGLLHDIGKLKIPSQFYTSKDVTPAKRKFVIEKHPEYSIEFVNNVPAISDNVKQLIREHHEYADGSGYPKGLTKDKLHPHSLIVSMVNLYENLCYPYDESKARTPSQSLSYLFASKKAQFDEKQLSAFVKSLGIYPPGTLVKLNNGQIGIVITVNTAKLLAPCVMVFDEKIPRDEAAIVNLAQEHVTIESALSPRAVEPHIKNYLNPRSQLSFFIE